VRPIRLPNDLCARSFEYVSRELDGDLAEFEVALLRAHLGSCPECADLRDRMHAQTAALRMAPLEPMPAPVALPTRRRSTRGGVVSVGAIDRSGEPAAARHVSASGALETRAALPKADRLSAMQQHWLSLQPTRLVNRAYSAPY
jgi:anti-sigma factor RsiW